NGVDADATGIYLGGFTTDTLPGQLSSGSYDAFVRKLNFSLNELWTHQFGTSEGELGTGNHLVGDAPARGVISVDASGVYVTGSTTGMFDGQTSSGSLDAYVRKYDLAGGEMWTRQFGFGHPANVIPSSSAADADGNVYVVGDTNGAFPGQSMAAGANF